MIFEECCTINLKTKILMINFLKIKIKKNAEIFALFILILVTIVSTSYYNFNKKKIYSNYKTIIYNVYLQKTLDHTFNQLEPRFKEIEHKITPGETFDKILESYEVNSKEIKEIKSKVSKKINLNKLNTNHKIQFTIDQSSSLIKEFIFQITNTEKIYLSRNTESNKFDQKILVTKLNKNILYKENVILQSLYKSASKQKIPANIIVEFARIYGFQVDFQRDIRKNDSFQILYEEYKNDENKVVDFGNILYANLIIQGKAIELYHFNSETDKIFNLPLSAIKYTPAGAYVLTVHQDGTLSSLSITTGLVRSNTIEVEGLTGNEVIVSDVRGLKEGDSVTLQ